MMRFAPLLCLALLAAACTQTPAAPAAPARQEAAAPAAGCSRVVTRQITFSSESAQDVITARAEGPNCEQAFVLLELRNAEGAPLWVFATTYAEMAGSGFHLDRAAAVAPEAVDAFLANWANVQISRSGSLPEWTEGAASLSAAAQDGMNYDTPFGREAYEALRGRNLPQLCFNNGMESSQCLIMDPASHAPTVIVFMGV